MINQKAGAFASAFFMGKEHELNGTQTVLMKLILAYQWID
jgi:hypothetical protein